MVCWTKRRASSTGGATAGFAKAVAESSSAASDAAAMIRARRDPSGRERSSMASLLVGKLVEVVGQIVEVVVGAAASRGRPLFLVGDGGGAILDVGIAHEH